MDAAPQVLVQGIADVDYRDLEANRVRYTRESAEKLPGSKELLPPEPLQRVFSFYFTRLYVHVRPERVYVWPQGDATREPELFDAHMEEVRSGHDEEPEGAARRRPRAARPRGTRAWTSSARSYPEAVLSLVAPDGFPFSVRVPISVDRRGAARAHRRRRAGRAGAARASPAWPRTPRTEFEWQRTSRCAATSWRRTAAGRSCRTG